MSAPDIRPFVDGAFTLFQTICAAYLPALIVYFHTRLPYSSGTLGWCVNLTLVGCINWLPLSKIYANREFTPVVTVIGVVFNLCISLKTLSFLAYHSCLREFRKQPLVDLETHLLKVSPEIPVIQANMKEILQTTTSVWDFFGFLCMPTLCYQPIYPRVATVNRTTLLENLLGTVICFGLLKLLIIQYISPILANAVLPVSELNYLAIGERLLKIALPAVLFWITLFLMVFQFWLSFLAELTRFADKCFFYDWWNATDIGEYWQRWNLPIHTYICRHVFNPLVELGYNKTSVILFVFFLSGVLHEYVVDAMMHQMPRRPQDFNVFFGFMLQPLCRLITRRAFFKERFPVLGNAMVWFTICVVGQPGFLLNYYIKFCESNIC